MWPHSPKKYLFERPAVGCVKHLLQCIHSIFVGSCVTTPRATPGVKLYLFIVRVPFPMFKYSLLKRPIKNQLKHLVIYVLKISNYTAHALQHVHKKVNTRVRTLLCLPKYLQRGKIITQLFIIFP